MDHTRFNDKKKNYKIIIICAVLFTSLFFLFCVVNYLNAMPITNVCKVEYVSAYEDILIQNYYKGQVLNFPEDPSRDGYNFIGWSLDINNGELLPTGTIVEKEMVLYPKWEEKIINLKYRNETYNINHLTKINGEGLNISFNDINGKNISISSQQKEGYSFDKWIILDDNKEINILEYSFSHIISDTIELIPLYTANEILYSINSSDLYSINIASTGKVVVGDVLSFELVLNDNVNKSDIDINSTSGNVDVNKVENKYLINITNYTKNFEIIVNNIKTNNYHVSFIDDKNYNYQIEHGKALILPDITKQGYDLLGFKDIYGNTYNNGDIVCSDLELHAIWQLKSLSVSFPKNNGKFAIKYMGKAISNKVISLNYGDELSFEIELADAYSHSHISVYGKNNFGIVMLANKSNVYTLSSVTEGFEIVVENLEINKYEIIVDSLSYGKVTYGSIIEVVDDNIIINDYYSNNIINIEKLVEDNDFYGWFVGDKVLTHSSIQSLAIEDKVEINGEYSKIVCVLKFNANGGILDVDYLVVTTELAKISLPIPEKAGYTFVGWFVELVEINSVINMEKSTLFNGINGTSMILYAGWTK